MAKAWYPGPPPEPGIYVAFYPDGVERLARWDGEQWDTGPAITVKSWRHHEVVGYRLEAETAA